MNYKGKHILTLREFMNVLLDDGVSNADVINVCNEYWGTPLYDLSNILSEVLKERKEK